MKRAVFYGRYSSANQTEQSIEGQLHVCEKFAAQNGMEITAQYIDRAQTGTNANRKAFQQMISDSEGGGFEIVLVYKLDRFARNRFDSAMYKRKLRDNGVKVVSATENIADTPEGIIMEAVLEGMDEYYSAELSRKMRRGREESFRKGKFLPTHVPFGYRKVDKHLAIDETTAPIAAEIFRRYAAGERLKDIEIWLNGISVRNAAGNEWDACSLSRLLHRSYYYGEYKFGDFEGAVPCPAIITRELFDKVQDRLAASAQRRRESSTGFDYMLTGKFFCAEHHRMISGISKDGKYFRYRCLDCHHVYDANAMHERVLSALAEYLTEDKLDEIAQAAFEVYMQEQKVDERPAMEDELKNIEKRIQNAVDAVLNGFANEALKQTMMELEERRNDLRHRIENAPTPLPKFTLEQFRLILERIAAESPRSLLDTFVNRVILYEDKLIICINLTDENNTPPLEQVVCSVAASCPTATLHALTTVPGWLLIAA